MWESNVKVRKFGYETGDDTINAKENGKTKKIENTDKVMYKKQNNELMH